MNKILFVFLSLLSFGLIAQTPLPDYANSMYRVVAPSPDVASLGKFGNIPVSMNTGTPDISIPLININVGQINLPIQLSYHSAGFRVDEMSSSVGLGWSMIAAPSISRSLVGLPDEDSNGFVGAKIPTYSALRDTLDKYWNFFYDAAMGRVDTEQDIFNYNILNTSGRFLINRDKSIFQVPVTDNKIALISGGFTVTNNKGERFFFTEKENTNSRDLRGTVGVSYTSTWHVSKIISSNNCDTIYFTYKECSSIIINRDEFSASIGSRPVHIPTDEGGQVGSEALTGEPQISTQQTIYSPKLISSIRFRGGIVEFGYSCLRTDVLGGQGPRLSEVSLYRGTNDSKITVKKVILSQDYFYNNRGNDYKNYRLRLLEVKVYGDEEKMQPQVYKLTYNNAPLAAHNSYSQDFWGFNNGKNNSNLIPRSEIYFNNKNYFIGGADRSTDTTLLKDGLLQDITYPTGGKTTFQFEPHKYMESSIQWVPVSPSPYCGASSGVSPSGIYDNPCSVQFTPQGEIKEAFIEYSFSSYSTSSTQRPEINLTDLTTGIKKTFVNLDPYNSRQAKEVIDLIVGHEYKLEVNVFPNHKGEVSANGRITYLKKLNEPLIRYGGGLRIKAITNFNSDGKVISKDLYRYGFNEDGNGRMLTDPNLLYFNYNNVNFSFGYSGGHVLCQYITGPLSRTYTSSGTFPISYVAGTPIIYSTVTKYQLDKANLYNGKETFYYSIEVDGGFPMATLFNPLGTHLISNSWKNGLLKKHQIFAKTSTGLKVVEETTNFYIEKNISSIEGIKIKRRTSHSGCEAYSADYARMYFDIANYPIKTGVLLLDSSYSYKIDINSGNKISDYYKLNYESSSHLNPTYKKGQNSRGEKTVEVFKYPHNFLSISVYQKMIDRNMISSLVEYQNEVNGKVIDYTKINFRDWLNNGNLLVPDSIQKLSSIIPVNNASTSIPSFTTIKFHNYDKYGNILEQSKAGDIKTVYIWGYNNQYPVAEIKNSSYAEIRNILTQTYLDQLNLSPASDVDLRLKFQQLRENALLKSSMVSSFTFLPLVGMTSQTNSAGINTFYEYDDFQRLKRVRDNENNIIKFYEYNYQIK